jgi:hypothetical protein
VYIQIKQDNFFKAFKDFIKPLVSELCFKYFGIIILPSDILTDVDQYFLSIFYNGYFSKNTLVDIGGKSFCIFDLIPKLKREKFRVKRRNWHAFCKDIKHKMKIIIKKYVDVKRNVLKMETIQFGDIYEFDEDDEFAFEVEEGAVVEDLFKDNMIIKPLLLQIKRFKRENLNKVKTIEKNFSVVDIIKKKKCLKPTKSEFHYIKACISDCIESINKFDNSKLKKVDKTKYEKKRAFFANGNLLYDQDLDVDKTVQMLKRLRNVKAKEERERVKYEKEKAEEKRRKRKLKEKQLKEKKIESEKRYWILRALFKIRLLRVLKPKIDFLKIRDEFIKQPMMTLKEAEIYRTQSKMRYLDSLDISKVKMKAHLSKKRYQFFCRSKCGNPKCNCGVYKLLTVGHPRSIIKKCIDSSHREEILTALIMYKYYQSPTPVNLLKKADSDQFKKIHPEFYTDV